MTRYKRFARPRTQCAGRCPCSDCAELDLAYPGEGTQLALPLRDLGPLAPPSRRLETA